MNIRHSLSLLAGELRVDISDLDDAQMELVALRFIMADHVSAEMLQSIVDDVVSTEQPNRNQHLGPLPMDKRFWPKVDERGPDECWEWQASMGANGYGLIQGFSGKTTLAHRVAYELTTGPIPEGYSIDHLCRNRRCVNPRHLEAVPQRTNVLRGEGLSAINAAKTHCVHGHPFDDGNTAYETIRGHVTRRCKTCSRESARRIRERKRAEGGTTLQQEPSDKSSSEMGAAPSADPAEPGPPTALTSFQPSDGSSPGSAPPFEKLHYNATEATEAKMKKRLALAHRGEDKRTGLYLVPRRPEVMSPWAIHPACKAAAADGATPCARCLPLTHPGGCVCDPCVEFWEQVD